MSLLSFLLRFMSARNDKKRDRNLTQPEGISVLKDISYGPLKEQLLDVYRPKNCENTLLPVIVSVHGGGWVYGDKEVYRYYCMDLAARGFAVVNFTYRLSPEFKFPCHLEDTVLAFHWVLKHGTQYGMNLEQVFAVGDSAGGHILALFCNLCTNPVYAAKYSFVVPTNFVPKAVALNCGVYDLVSAKTTASSAVKLIKDVLGHSASDEELKTISPVNYITPEFPPCYIMTANYDFLRAQPEVLIKVLEEKRVPYEYYCYGDETHKLEHVFHLNINSPQGAACNDAQCRWFLNFVHKN